MVTRVFCDHCGNAVTNFKRYGYGPLMDFYPQASQAVAAQQAQAYAAQQNAGLMYGAAVNAPQQGVAGQAANYPAPPRAVAIQSVDLCTRCESIWMKRVADLSFRNHVDITETEPE